jgi:enoyl-CoA hydratase
LSAALRQEYRFTSRSASEGDFVEGIRAAIIDKDRNPRWRHAVDFGSDVLPMVEAMLAEAARWRHRGLTRGRAGCQPPP